MSKAALSGKYAAYPEYPEYKDSEVEWLGEVPSHWDILYGKRIFNTVRKKALETDEQLAASQKFGVIPQTLMMQLNDSKVMLALKGTESFRHVDKSNFVISLRSFEGGIEHSNYIGCVSPAYTVLAAVKNVEPKYFKYLLKSASYIAALQASTDSLRDGKSISYENFGNIELPLMAVKEQTQIVAFLDHETTKIDTLIEKQQQLIKLLKEKRQAVISHAVTKGLNPQASMKNSGVEWLGEVPEHWGVGHIGYYGRVINGSTPSKANNNYWNSKDIPWLSSGTVNQYHIKNASDYISNKALKECSVELLPVGTLVLGMIGQGKTRGTSAVTKIEATINQNLAAIIPDHRLLSDYGHLFLQAAYNELRECARGGNQAALNCEIISDFKITIPPISEQEIIIDKVTSQLHKIDLLQNKLNGMVTNSEERRTALISAAVTGKIDVRNWVAPTTSIDENEAAQEVTA